MKVFRNISDHADDLEDGRVIGVGETFELDDEQLKSEFNKDKISRDVFLEISEKDQRKLAEGADDAPVRKELLARAKELDITHRNNMRNDELQTAILEVEGRLCTEGGSD